MSRFILILIHEVHYNKQNTWFDFDVASCNKSVNHIAVGKSKKGGRLLDILVRLHLQPKWPLSKITKEQMCHVDRYRHLILSLWRQQRLMNGVSVTWSLRGVTPCLLTRDCGRPTFFYFKPYPVNTKQLHSIYTIMDQRRRRWPEL